MRIKFSVILESTFKEFVSNDSGIVIASVAKQSPRYYFKCDKIASSYLLAMTYY